MVARITRFYSRAELGMAQPRTVSRLITPQQGGVAVHYGGGGPSPAPTTHAAAKRIWLGWQDYHMDGHGWADIAYTAGYDQLGNVYAGRGLGVRTAANGTNAGNDDYYAFVWIGGGAAVPSPAALDALDWLIANAREKGNAGDRVRPHKAFTGTACPGVILTQQAALRDRKAIPVLTPTPGGDTGPLKADGSFGPATRRALQQFLNKRYHPTVPLKLDGDFGPASRLLLELGLNWEAGQRGWAKPRPARTTRPGITTAHTHLLRWFVGQQPYYGRPWDAETTRALQRMLNRAA